MAENVCEVARNRNKKIRLMSENGEFLSVSREKQVSDDGLNLKSIFYLNNLENNCFTKYSVNNDGVNRSSGFCPHVDGFPPECKGICPNNDENCMKKRCSDRYDSSESSDSGIAVSSSASSGTSDITDPGSPFSTSSDDSSSSPAKCKEEKRCKSEEKSPGWSQPSGRCRSEEKTWTQPWESKQQQNDKTDHNFITPETDFKMAPNVPSASSPCGIWTSINENNTANETAHFNKFKKSEAIINNNNNNINNNTKRLKIDGVDALTINDYIAVVNVPSLVGCENDKGGTIPENADCGKVMTVRRLSCDKKEFADGQKISKMGVKTCEKSVGCVAKPKQQDRNRHQGKITEYFKSQVKSLVGVKRDYNYGKKDAASQVKRIDTGKSHKAEESIAKKCKADGDAAEMTEKTAMEVPVFVKPSPKNLQTVMPLANKLLLPKLPKAPDFLTKKPPETKTLFNKILQNHKNRKLAEMKSKGSGASVTLATATAEGVAGVTGAATPVAAIPVIPTPISPAAKAAEPVKPYEFSTRSATNTELPKKVEELSSNLDEKVQNKGLDSNLLKLDSKVTDVVNCELVISKAKDSPECESMKSPILSAPKTIRFPANCHNNNLLDKHMTSRSPSVVCRWDACLVECGSATGLLEHLQNAHVLTQVSGEKFVCLWVGCKVFDQKSCSRSWLERHVLSHAGNKPFRCIVDGCGQGFSSQTILERHVNNHFQADVKKALDSPLAHKLFRRNGKKIRYRRQPWSARMFDFFDSGIMEVLEYRLVKLTKIRTGGDVTDTSGKSLALTSQVVARRMTANGRQQFLLRWYPLNIVEDEWVYEKDVVQKKIVSIPSLSPSVSSSLQETLELVMRPSGSCRRKNKMNYQTKPQNETRHCEELFMKKIVKEEDEEEEVDFMSAATVVEENDLMEEISKEPHLPPPPKVPDKMKTKTRVKKRRKVRKTLKMSEPQPPALSVSVVDSTTAEEPATTGKIVSLKPKEEESIVTGATPAAAALPEEVPLVPAVCPSTEEIIPVQTGGIIMDSTKLIAPVKTDMILSSPVKLVTSQYIEQPFVQTVMPVQMPVAYQIPIVKLSPPSGMFLPQIPNYIIPPSPPAVFPTSPVSTFRNGFQLSATGTIQIQTSSTTLQQTSSNFMQSTNTSGFQIVQSPMALPQSILTAFQNSGIANLGLKSPTLRLLNCQPLILNKPIANVSMTVTNVTTTRAEQNGNALTMPTPAAAGAAVTPLPLPMDQNKNSRKISTPNRKLVKQKLTILPKPNISPKTSAIAVDGVKNKKQCLQPCGPTTRAAT